MLVLLGLVLLLWFVLHTCIPETLGLGSASPLTDAKRPVVELLSTPPRRGRRWLTETCSMNEVPYLRKYHHSNICCEDTYGDNMLYKKCITRPQLLWYPLVATAIISIDQWFLSLFCHALLWRLQKMYLTDAT